MKITTVQLIEHETKPGEIKHTEQKIVGTGSTAIAFVFEDTNENDDGIRVKIKNSLCGEIEASTVRAFAVAVANTVKAMVEKMPEKTKEKICWNL